MTAYTSRLGGTAGGLAPLPSRISTIVRLIDVDAEAVKASISAFAATDTLAIMKLPIGSTVMSVSVKVEKVASTASGTVSTGVTGAATQFLSATALTGSVVGTVVTSDANTTQYPCVAASKDVLLTFNTAVPTGAKFKVSITLLDAGITNPVSEL